MKLAVLVTEFPKTTETFILRDLMVFLEAGVDLRLYHLAPWRQGQILHDFAQPLASRARHIPLAGAQARGALWRNRGLAARLAGTIARHQGRDTAIAAKSVALLPAAFALAEELADWGADHVHAEFAGHPATVAWAAHHLAGVSYSVSCRAHDIFRSQRLLAQKFSRASAVRTVSDFGRRFLARTVRGMTEDDMEVIHSSVDVGAIAAEPARRQGAFRILYVGSLQPRKGVDVLLRALARFDRPRWSAEIVGDGPDRAALESLAMQLGLSEKVRFAGQQGYEAIAARYPSASVCVAPSIIGPKGRTEGIPNVMIEALAHRRPAISTSVSGIPELIRPGVTGWLTAPGDVAGLVQALREVHDDPAEADRRAEAGRRHVAEAFDLDTNARRQLALFDAASAAAPMRRTA